MSTEWTYLLADLRTNLIYCEIPLKVETVTQELNNASALTASLAVRSIIGDPYRFTTPGRTCVYVLRDGLPWWGGIIWTRTYDGAGTISIGAGDWWSYYDKRTIITSPGRTGGGAPAPGSVDDPAWNRAGIYDFTNTDQVEVVRKLLELASSVDGGDLDIELIPPASNLITRTMPPLNNVEIKSFGDAFEELTKGDTGCDLMFGVRGFTSTGAPKRVLYVGGPHLTHGATGVVWEYGGNMLTYKWASDATQFASRVWLKAGGTGQRITMMRGDNMTRLNEGWPLIEYASTVADTFRDPEIRAAVNAELALRDLPQVVPQLTVRTDRPPHLNFAPGDYATMIIEDEYFRTQLVAEVRITKITVNMGADTATIDVNAITADIP